MFTVTFKPLHSDFTYLYSDFTLLHSDFTYVYSVFTHIYSDFTHLQHRTAPCNIPGDCILFRYRCVIIAIMTPSGLPLSWLGTIMNTPIV
jgi:hypothetical protein